MRRLMKKLNLMSPEKLTGVITLLACLFFLAGAAGATVLYDNLGATPAYPYPLADFGPLLFNSFSTGAGGFNLSQVDLLVAGSDSPGAGSFSVGLYSDASTSPGSLLTTIGTVSDSALTSTPSVATFNLPSPYSLAAGTRYWVGLASADSVAAWMYSYEGGVGVAGEYWGSTADGVVANYVGGFSTGPYEMRVSHTPLPGALLLLCAGMARLVAYGRRKRVASS